LGLKALATLSTGESITGPKPHRRFNGRLRRLNRSLSRKRKGSANWKKAKAKLSRLHKRIADIREDAAHKLSHRLATKFDVIGIEDLNVKGMAKNCHIARPVGDMGLRSLRAKIEYKAAMTGAIVVVADRWFPSSKTCSGCGRHHPEIVLGVDTLRCDCGLVIDRDLNAAINLANYAASSAVSAYGEEGSGVASAA
jgi:putative transposase